MQDLAERQAADARLTLLSNRRVTLVVLVGVSLTAICTLLVLWVSFILTSADGPRAISIDFRVYWAAGKMALEGDFLGVFDTPRLTSIHNVLPENWMPWLYPPGFLFLVSPFGAVSFATGLTIWSLLSIGVMALAVRSFAAGSWVIWLAFSLAPAYLPTLLQGQNGLIWLAGFIASLAALRDGRWVLAGIFIGLLTLKPQLGLLIPLALIAAGLWRTTLVATLTAGVVAALPILATGPEFWALFVLRMAEYGESVIASIQSQDLMSSPFALFVRLGVPPETALTLQAGVTISAGLAVAIIWRARNVAFDVKAAALLAGSLLASPYAWHYEAAIMAPVGLFLTRAGVLQPKPTHLLLLAVLWLGAGFQVMTIFVGLADIHFPWAVLVTPVLVLSLSLCLSQAFFARRTKVVEG
jgi:hypothetical protein